MRVWKQGEGPRADIDCEENPGKPSGEGRIRKAVALSNLRNGIVEMEVRYECLRNNRTYSYPIYCIAAQVPAIRAPGL